MAKLKTSKLLSSLPHTIIFSQQLAKVFGLALIAAFPPDIEQCCASHWVSAQGMGYQAWGRFKYEISSLFPAEGSV